MGRLISPKRKEMATKRFKFLFYEVVPIFAIIFILLIFEWTVLPLIVDQSTALFGTYFYYIWTLSIFLGINLFFFVLNKIKSKKQEFGKEELALHRGYLKLYSMTKKNYGYQLLYSILIFFLILIPLDYVISIILPETILFQFISSGVGNSFLELPVFIQFLFSSIIIQFSIAFANETIYRGLVAKRGSEHFNKLSAVFISTLYFAFSRVFLNPISTYFGLLFFLKAFIVGLVLSLTVIRRKWIFPLIIATTIENVISSVIVWDFINVSNFNYNIQLINLIYIPLLVISLIILILQRSRIRESLQIGIKMIKSYVQTDIKLKESSGDIIFRILFDVFFAFLLFLFGFLISV